MKIILSQDVSNYIFIFLFFSSSFEKLFCLSKLTTKTLKNTIEYKTFTKYNEIFEMMREDKSSFITDLSYEKIWFKYYKYRWPPLIKEDIGTNHELCEYKIGDFVDAKDFMNAWCPAKIININFKRKYVFTKGNNLIVENGEKIYEVEFLGWSTSFNEKIDKEKIRKLTTYTTNPRDKMYNLHKETFDKFWCLIKNKDDKEWKMERISEKITDISNNLLLVSSTTKIYKISKENIDDIILPISNASCFLANTDIHIYNHEDRKFYL